VPPETVIIAASGVCLGLALVLVRLVGTFSAPPSIPVTTESIDELSVEVTDLLRILDQSDGQFLRTHLRQLEHDFKLTTRAIKLVVVQSNYDRPDLVRFLVKNQITFTYRLMRVRVRLACQRYGLWFRQA
jgi:hypothetical protein